MPNFLSDVDNETLKAAAGVCLLDDSFCVVDLLNAGAEVALDTQQTNIESQEKGIEIGKFEVMLILVKYFLKISRLNDYSWFI